MDHRVLSMDPKECKECLGGTKETILWVLSHLQRDQIQETGDKGGGRRKRIRQLRDPASVGSQCADSIPTIPGVPCNGWSRGRGKEERCRGVFFLFCFYLVGVATDGHALPSSLDISENSSGWDF